MKFYDAFMNEFGGTAYFPALLDICSLRIRIPCFWSGGNIAYTWYTLVGNFTKRVCVCKPLQPHASMECHKTNYSTFERTVNLTFMQKWFNLTIKKYFNLTKTFQHEFVNIIWPDIEEL